MQTVAVHVALPAHKSQQSQRGRTEHPIWGWAQRKNAHAIDESFGWCSAMLAFADRGFLLDVAGGTKSQRIATVKDKERTSPMRRALASILCSCTRRGQIHPLASTRRGLILCLSIL